MSDDDSDREATPVELALTAFEEQASQGIRTAWHEGRWFFSVVDTIGLLTGSPNPRRYWSDMKRDVADEGFREVYALSVQLKMRSPDGKERLTDAADAETLLRLIQSIRSPRAEPLKRWLARVGAERLEEIERPELAADRMRRVYKRRGYSDEWIHTRLQCIVTRDELTGEWHERGAHEGREFAILTEILHSGTFDIATEEHKAVKALKRRDNLRDNMTGLELALTILSEATATELHRERDSQGMSELSDDARQAGEVGGAARRDVEARLGRPVVSSDNAKTLTARPERQPALFGSEASADGADNAGESKDEG